MCKYNKVWGSLRLKVIREESYGLPPPPQHLYKTLDPPLMVMSIKVRTLEDSIISFTVAELFLKLPKEGTISCVYLQPRAI